MDNNFVKLEISEVINKFHRLVKEKVQVKLWKKGESSKDYRTKQVRVLKSDARITMVMFSEDHKYETSNVNNIFYVSFELNDLAYFSEGKISLSDEEQFEFVITDPVYRTESRINERLITFPHHKVYAFFKIPDSQKEVTNVVQLRKAQAPAPTYDDYKIKQKERIYQLLEAQVGKTEGLVDFRVLDISQSGVAFQITNSTKSFFDKLTGADFFLLFEEEVFKMSGAKTVYVVDLLAQAQKKDAEALYKVGMTYLPQPVLTQKINLIIHSSEKFDAMRKEFESFKDQ